MIYDMFKRAVIFSLLLIPAVCFADIFADPGFTTETVTALDPFTLVGAAFAPDGRIFLWQAPGIVRIYKNGALLPQPFIDISDHVNIGGDRGLLGLALDPNIDQNGYVYLLYNYEHAGQNDSHEPRTARLTRVQADPNNPDVALPGETVLLGTIGVPPCSNYPEGADCIPDDSDSHTIGTVMFAPDGKLFVGNGDGASYTTTDPLALRAQNLNLYSGKILRINPDGSAPIDNPFYDGTNSIRSKVWAYGLRNPFRFGLDPVLGEPVIGDVGWDHWEEVNRGRGANFGWPCYEGDGPNLNYMSTFELCQQLDPDTLTFPIYDYPHPEGLSITGGVFYTGDVYPEQYQGNFFIADYTNDFMRRLVFDENQELVSVEPFATEIEGVVNIQLGPDGLLYYVALLSGELRRIRFNGPSAQASATPTSGNSPLNVAFSSAGSVDPTGQELTYFWDFGDGATSTLPNPSHTYTSGTPQTFVATLTVTNEDNLTSSDSVSITVESNPPTATITAPADGTVVIPGQVVNYAGIGTDPEDGTLPGSSLAWTILLHHDDHVHTFESNTGPNGDFIVQDYGAGTYSYEIILKVTDSSGLTDTDIVFTPIDNGSEACLFCDEFDDNVLDPSWTYVKGNWVESNGALRGSGTRKAIAIAEPAFTGCDTCTARADLMSAGGAFSKVWFIGWRVDKKTQVELLMKEGTDRWILKQRNGGRIVTKAKAISEILPNVNYQVEIVFDGTNFVVSVDGAQIITMPKAPGTTPSGTVGFQSLGTTGIFGSIEVE